MKLYHISEKWLGKTPVFEPRTPLSRAEGESDTPRICLAPTVGQAWLAICHARPEHWYCPLHVYEVETDESIPADKTVDDRRRTGERWLLKTTKLRHVCKLPAFKGRTGIDASHGFPYRCMVVRSDMDAQFRWTMFLKRGK